MDYTLFLELPREDCAPRYKDVETLLAKANCMCSRFGVELTNLYIDFGGSLVPGPVSGFAIIDRCTPEELSPLGYHVITVVYDPNYLLSTMECICASEISQSEYITSESILGKNSEPVNKDSEPVNEDPKPISGKS